MGIQYSVTMTSVTGCTVTLSTLINATQLVAAFNLYFLEMGFGFQIPLGEEYSHLEGYEFTGMAKSSNWVLRLALRTEWRGWKQAPKFD